MIISLAQFFGGNRFFDRRLRLFATPLPHQKQKGEESQNQHDTDNRQPSAAAWRFENGIAAFDFHGSRNSPK